MASSKGLSKEQKSTIFALLSIYFLDNFGLAIAYPIFTPLILKTHLGLLNPACSFDLRTLFLGIILASFPIGQFAGAPILGYLADLKGRKKAFYLTLSGEIFSFLLSAAAIHLHSYTLLFASRLLTGFFAGNLTICLSAIADISGSDPKKRAKNFGLLASATGVSFILAIIVGGYFSNEELNPLFTSSLPFVLTSFLALCNLGIIYLFFREQPIRQQTKASTFFFAGLRLPRIRMLFVIFFLVLIAWIGSLQFLSAIEIEFFKASKEAITLTFISGGVIWAFGNAYINPLLLKKLYPKEITSFFMPLFAVGLLGMALSLNLLIFLLFFNLASFSASLIWTNLLAIISHNAPSNMQGRTLGFNQSVTSLATCIAPILGALLAGQSMSLTYLSYVMIVALAYFIFLLNNTLVNEDKKN